MRQFKMFIFCCALVLVFVPAFQAAAQQTTPTIIEEVYVTGGRDNIQTLSGSAALIDETQIHTFNSTDLTSLLTQVPGVYIRGEDGYGLRPNIGLRGATSDRSQKVTLMEDGILISPAPYSAPAAYYFPNSHRMAAVEVFKGPAAIHYGPHTVGGAINMVTRPVPTELTRDASFTLGSDQYHNARVFFGDSGDTTAYWVDALSYGASGFKTLPTGDTGFTRNDINTKWQWRSDAQDPKHIIDVKLGYADEVSDETYLGLTDDDFAANPNQRYAATALDKFDSKHYQLHLLTESYLTDALTLNTKTYVNRFNRDWFKFDGFYAPADSGDEDYVALSAQSVLANPNIYPVALGLLRGTVNANGSAEQTLRLTDNAREYGSQGIEMGLEYQLVTGALEHTLESSVRYHQDYVDRAHGQYGYLMQDGFMVFDGIDRPLLEFNRAQADAFAFALSDEIVWQKWKWDIGVRIESIETNFTNKAENTKNTETQTAVIPGIGVFYQWREHLGFLAGVNKGFSPNSATESDTNQAEESVNIEYGFRYNREALVVEAIGFFSDYQNLLGRCRASDVNCSVGQEFDGGAIEISGLEFTGRYEWPLSGAWTMPMSLNYSYTEAYFQTGFVSSFSQWGAVQPGDELPYTPQHQARLDWGFQHEDWQAMFAIKYIGDMREVPGQSVDETYALQAYTVVDVSVMYDFNSRTSIKLLAENVSDEQTIVARRPFGARPNHPRAVKLGVDFEF